MSFTVDDETAYHRRRDELGRDFAAWCEQHSVAADLFDVQLLLDWKWGYGDGTLNRWSLPDVEEFLLEWCPRKLSSSPEHCAGIPLSVAAFLDFLAHHDLLAPGSQSPAAMRRYCERIGPRFRREMSDPANFGMAKSLLGGGVDPAALERLMELTGTDPEELLDLLGDGELLESGEPDIIGPVRLPTPTEHLETLRTAPTVRQVRGLADRCPPPGLPVTARGNLRLADAHRLVIELDTGDEADPQQRTLQSATELPHLSWLVELAVTVGAVTRDGGRLLARSEFAELPEPQAYQELVRAAVELGLATPTSGLQDVESEHEFLVEAAPQLLATLLAAHAVGEPVVPVGELLGLALGIAEPTDPAAREYLARQVARQLERLSSLGVLQAADDPAEPDAGPVALSLTPAGVTVSAALVADLLDVEVVLRADPNTADAATLAESLLLLERDEAEADLRTWFDAQPDPVPAAGALLAELAAEAQPDAAVLVGLDLAGAALGEHAETAAQAHLDGVHGPVVLTWLLTRGAIDPADVDPVAVTYGVVTVAAALLDEAGPAGAVAFFEDSGHEQVLELLADLWRLDHERLPDVLDALGREHPDKKVAKAARRCLMQYRSRTAR